MQQLSEDLDSWMEDLRKKEEDMTKADSQTKAINARKAEEEKEKGNDYVRSKDYDLAIECYNQAENLAPDNAAIYCNRALVHLKLKRFQKVIEDCNKAIALQPDYVKAYNRRGKAYIELKEFREALKDFEFVIQSDPENSEANADLKRCREEVNKSGGFKRIQIVEEDEEEEENQSKPNDNLKELPKAELIQTHIEAPTQDPKEETLAEKLLDTGSESSEILNRTQMKKKEANDYFQQGKYEKAVDIYLEAVEELENLTKENPSLLSNEKGAFYNNIALCYQQESYDNKVIEYSSKALDSKPTDNNTKAKAYLRRAMAYERKENYKRARDDMIKAKELDPSNIQASKALQRYAEILFEDKEVTLLKEIETLDGLIQQVEKLKDAGNQLFKKEKLDEAIAEFSTGIEMIKNNVNLQAQLSDSRLAQLLVQLYNNRALGYLKLDCNNEVIKDCQKVLEIDSGNVKALYRLAKAEGNRGQFTIAAKHMKTVTEIEPSNMIAKKEFESFMKSAIEASKAEKDKEHKAGHSEKHVGFNEFPEEIKINPKLKSNDSEIKLPAEEKKTPKPKATVFSEETVLNAKRQAFEQLGALEIPKNSTAFEVSINSIKTDASQVYSFLHVKFI